MQRCKVLNNTAKPRGISEEWTVEKKSNGMNPALNSSIEMIHGFKGLFTYS